MYLSVYTYINLQNNKTTKQNYTYYAYQVLSKLLNWNLYYGHYNILYYMLFKSTLYAFFDTAHLIKNKQAQ